MKEKEIYLLSGVQYSLIGGAVMMRVRSVHEWKLSVVNKKRHEVNFFKSHVAAQGQLIKQEVAA